jgi:hypothetical protein
MNLLEIRTRAAEVSGRYDLVDPTTYANTGMDSYIRAGQIYLDTNYFGTRANGVHVETIDANTAILKIPYIRSVRTVYIMDEESKLELTKKSLDWLKEKYPATANVRTSGTPLYYARTPSRFSIASDQLACNSLQLKVFDAELMMDPEYKYSYFKLFPPPDTEATIEVHGNFYTTPMTSDLHTCFWAQEFSELMIWATLRSVEVTHRNTQGVNDWDRVILNQLQEIDFDDLTEEIEGLNQIEG